MSFKILVTGGAGFIGSHLVGALIREKHDVTVLDDFSRGKRENLSDVPTERLTIRSGDLSNPSVFAELAGDCDVFFHLAAINGTGYFYSKPDQVLDLNTRMTIHAVHQAVKHRVGRFVFFSSSETYQLPPKIPTPEEVPLLVPDIANPRFSYAVSKILGEAYCHYFLARRGIRFTIIRPHNFYGPRMGFKHVIPEMAAKCLEAPRGGTITLQGSGRETRSFCYIDDAIEGIIKAAQSEKAANETLHIGSDEGEIEIGSLVRFIMEKLGRNDLNLESGPPLEGSVKRRCPDVSKARQLLDFDPKTPLSEGLSKTLSWVRQCHEKGGTREE